MVSQLAATPAYELQQQWIFHDSCIAKTLRYISVRVKHQPVSLSACAKPSQ